MANISGHTLGQYEILELIGRGGMANVYRAVQTSIGREVAVKVLPATFLQDATFLERFNREVQVIARLQHPCILPVYDFGEQDGLPYIVMAYLPGGSLADRIQQLDRGMTLDEAMYFVEQITRGLDFAHSKGIVHRDFKPSNVLLDEQSNIYLADFGIAKAAEETARLTGSGLIGTPAYMAPEMARRGGVTPRIDVYALGVTLFQMVAGRLPFDAETPAGMLMAHVTEPVPDACERRPDLPDEVQVVIERAMAKDPTQRYQSAGDLALDLRAIIEGGSIVVHVPVEAPLEYTPSEMEVVLVRAPTPPDVPTMDVVEPVSAVPSVGPARRWRGVSAVLTAGLVVGALLIVGVVAAVVALVGLGGDRAGTTPEVAEAQPTATRELTELALTSTPTATSTATLTPTETVTPTETSAHVPAVALAFAGVSSNNQWIPYTQEFNDVPMALVPAGCFQMGSEDGADHEHPVHEVCFEEPFWIDVYEVTNGQVGEAACTDYSSEDNQPRICISWLDSLAHCEARGARLPTEAEWEYAARGPDGLVYPWGNTFVADNVVYRENDPGGTAPVGSRSGGVSWVGALDLSGNVWEWVADWYDRNYYEDAPRNNPQGPNYGTVRVLRGGSWGHSDDGVRAANRYGNPPDLTRDSLGFRCARSSQP